MLDGHSISGGEVAVSGAINRMLERYSWFFNEIYSRQEYHNALELLLPSHRKSFQGFQAHKQTTHVFWMVLMALVNDLHVTSST